MMVYVAEAWLIALLFAK